MNRPIKILIVEDSEYDYNLLMRELTKSDIDFDSELVDTREGFETSLLTFKPDIVVSDFKLPSFDGITALNSARQICPGIPFIIISGTIGEEKAVELIKDGLTDYALKDKLFTLPFKINRALKEAAENQQKIIAEKKLIQSEKQLAKAQEIAHLGNWEIDVTTGIVSISEEAKKIFNQLPDSETNLFEKADLYDIWLSQIHPDDKEDFIRKVNQSKDSPSNSSIHYRILTNQGEVKHIYLERKYEFDDQGKVIRRFGIVQDVTNLKSAQELLEKSEQNLRAIFDNTSTGFLLLDSNFNIISFNKQLNHFAERSLGFTIHDADLIKLMLPEVKNELRSNFERVLKGESVNYEISYPPGAEKSTWYKINGNPVINQEGNITGICIAIDNINARKKAERKFRKQYNALRKTNFELDRFVYSASHDLRAPLKSMLGLINISISDTQQENDQYERLEMLNQSVVKLDNVIEDILHYSRNIHMEIISEEIDLEQTVHEIIQKYKSIESIKSIKLEVEIHQDQKLVSDKRRVHLVLSNLISNALKYTDTTKEVSFVKILIHCSANNAIITLEDNGIGIAEKDREKIFEMFYRGTKISTTSGLGLYIVKETLDKLGGSITHESQLNKGTIFTATIPNQALN